MTGGMHSTRSRRPRALAAMAGAAVMAALLAILVMTAWSWHQSLVDDRRFLPGTTIAGVDVGEETVDDALAAVHTRVDEKLDHRVIVAYDEREWDTTPRQLSGTADAEAVVDAAFADTESAGIVELVRIRWLGGAAYHEGAVAVSVSDDQARAFVDGVADEVDRDVTDASVQWEASQLALVEHETGLRVDRDAATSQVQSALGGAADRVELPVDEEDVTVTTEAAEQALSAMREPVESVMSRTVTVTYEDQTWPVSARDLGGVPDLEPVLASALETGAAQTASSDGDWSTQTVSTDPAISVSFPGDELAAFVANVGAEVEVPAVDASIDWSSGGIEISEERTGLRVDASVTEERLRSALDGGADTVEVPVESVAPAVTTASYRDVVLLRQGERRVYHYVDGTEQASWPVAVGTLDTPTPTGTFTVGAKRSSPTWHNPSPDGWGSDMPAVVEPGPNNPLGVRAMNWNQGGADTLIRFHGTPNEGSIGQAASQGCVRLRNDDIIELFDRVPQGATIVSVS
jgi:lipoprotein-anchoring transpeptidase ErfK/SrfK